jgi:hypothetical protein
MLFNGGKRLHPTQSVENTTTPIILSDEVDEEQGFVGMTGSILVSAISHFVQTSW